LELLKLYTTNGKEQLSKTYHRIDHLQIKTLILHLQD